MKEKLLLLPIVTALALICCWSVGTIGAVEETTIGVVEKKDQGKVEEVEYGVVEGATLSQQGEINKKQEDDVVETQGLLFYGEEDEDNDAEYSSGLTDNEEIQVEELQLDEFADIKKKDVLPQQYRLRIGDKLLISIYGEAGTQRTIEVDPTGSINYLYVDTVFVLGHTIDQVRKELETKLKQHFKYGLVSVTPIHFSGDFYSIMGEVRTPGLKFIGPRSSLLTALCESGGFNMRVLRNETVDHVDLKHSFLARDGTYVPVDFEKLVYQGDLSQDVPLKGGDYIFIPASAPNRVFVLGEVLRRVTIDYMKTITLMEALAEAGGVTYDASSRAVVIRGSLACPVRYLIDINRIFKGCACNFMLEPGDIVYVPPRQFTVVREIFNAAVQSFVTTAASSAGGRAFIAVHPHAAATGVIEPVPVITTGASPTTTVVTPIIAP